MNETAVTAEPAVAAAASVSLVEALLFASGRPVSAASLAEASELPLPEVEAALREIGRRCEAEGRGIRLDNVAGGWRFVARNEHDVPIRRLLGMDGRTKLSMAGLETLAIIAYRQPITAPEIAELRGVTVASSVRTLLDKKLITTAGRKPVVGTPFLYKTTKEFLVHFGLSDLSELPKPEELEALYGIEAGGPDPAQTELFPSGEAAPAEAATAPAPEGPEDPDAG
jgi:segregation and condensation protein B